MTAPEYSPDGKTLLRVSEEYRNPVLRVPEGVEVIGECACQENRHIREVILPDSVRTVRAKAFWHCLALERINLNQVTRLESAAFHGCMNLQAVELDSLPLVESRTFSSCRKLASVRFSPALKDIEAMAFAWCESLRELQLPHGLETIGLRAFQHCGLESVTVPSSVRMVGKKCFLCCPLITVYDSVDPDAAPCSEHLDVREGNPNSMVGMMGGLDNYVIRVLSAETGEIRYEVPMPVAHNRKSLQNLLTSSWGRNATFHFAALDRYFPYLRETEVNLLLALYRLKYPVELTEQAKQPYLECMRNNAFSVARICIDRRDMEMLQRLAPQILKREHMSFLIAHAAEKGAADAAAFLLEYRNANFGSEDPAEQLYL